MTLSQCARLSRLSRLSGKCLNEKSLCSQRDSRSGNCTKWGAFFTRNDNVLIEAGYIVGF
jgi:hypothetical protein